MLPAATEIQHCLPHGGGVCLGERSLASLHECAKGSDASAWPDHEHGCSQVARQLEAAATQPNRHSRRRRGTQLKACRTEACQEGRAHSEARRFKADDAAALGVIDHAVPPDDVLPRAIELAQRVAKYGGDRFCVGKHKERMHAPATAALRAETAAAGREYRSKL